MNVPCVITGLSVIHPYGNVFAAADLFDGESVWVLNCNVAGKTQLIDWRPIDDAHYTRTITLNNGFFERRGIIVALKSEAVLNDVAERYLHGK